MHYHEDLPDGTCLGFFDGSRRAGQVPEATFWRYQEEVARREHPAVRGHLLRMGAESWPHTAIEHARIRTALISTYRVHPRQYMLGGDRYPQSWPPESVKLARPERYSPPGTVGYYFGLTVDAALDEARYYDAQAGEPVGDESRILLVHRSCFHDLLYLAPVLPAVWQVLELPAMNVWKMYQTVMDPQTANDITDRIGLWAREAGFKGILYPSARYGQRLDWPEDQKRAAFPALEFVEIGSHLCEQGVAMQMTLNALAAALAELSFDDPPPIVFSEPNLVIFDEDHVAGRDRPVFYATYALREADLVRLNDERKGIKHRLQFAYDGNEIMLFVDNPELAFVARAPRHPHPGAPAVISYHHARTPDNAMRELDPDEKPSREIVEEKRRRFGPDHLETLSSVRSLAALQEAAGELPRAQAMFFGCLQGCRRTLGAGHGLTKSVEQDFRRCNQRLVRMKQAGESLPENNRTAEALVNLGDGQWRKAAARHLEANVYLVLLPIDPSMPPPTAEVLITIEWARATHVVSPKLRVTAQGELALMASLQ